MKRRRGGSSADARRHSTVGGVAAAMPEALPVFRALGITVAAAALSWRRRSPKRGLLLDFSDMVQKRAAQAEAAARAKDFPGMSPEVLSAYIEDTHHDYLRRALPRIERCWPRCWWPTAQPMEAFEVSGLFGRPKSDWNSTGQVLLFPALRAARRRRGARPGRRDRRRARGGGATARSASRRDGRLSGSRRRLPCSTKRPTKCASGTGRRSASTHPFGEQYPLEGRSHERQGAGFGQNRVRALPGGPAHRRDPRTGRVPGGDPPRNAVRWRAGS